MVRGQQVRIEAIAQIPGGTLDPSAVAKFETPLLIPPMMPKTGTIVTLGGTSTDGSPDAKIAYIFAKIPAVFREQGINRSGKLVRARQLPG